MVLINIAAAGVRCSLGANFDNRNDHLTCPRLPYSTREVVGFPKRPHLPPSGPYSPRKAVETTMVGAKRRKSKITYLGRKMKKPPYVSQILLRCQEHLCHAYGLNLLCPDFEDRRLTSCDRPIVYIFEGHGPNTMKAVLSS